MATAKDKPTTHQIEVRRTDEGSHVEFGVTIQGAWFPLGAFNAGEFDARIADAAAKSDE